MNVLIRRFWREPVVALTVAAVIVDVLLAGPFGLPPAVLVPIGALQAWLTRRLVSPVKA